MNWTVVNFKCTACSCDTLDIEVKHTFCVNPDREFAGVTNAACHDCGIKYDPIILRRRGILVEEVR